MTAPDQRQALGKLILGAIGVVYGDIGTSPLYAMREVFGGPHPLAPDRAHILGILSLIFWSVTIVVSLKYTVLMLRADNRGEGGSLALLALVSKVTHGTPLAFWVLVLGVFAGALFYGDSMLTPAISVLSAVEGLQVAAPAVSSLVVPVTLVILAGLFLIQRHGTGIVGALFGPVMCLWFVVLAGLGIMGIAEQPEVLVALDPRHAVRFFLLDGWLAFLALGSVVLALTGAEALYADMGHFGKRSIRIAWFAFALPALMLNYFGQGALLIGDPGAIDSPLYRLVPEGWRLAMLVLATCATIIASQAVISGAFSVTRQAIQLGLLPRMRIVHTSAEEIGQIYLPFINWMLCVFVMALVFGFQSSSNLASAYGVAVTGTMMIDTILVGLVMFLLWRWPPWLAGLAFAGLFAVDLAFFTANATKIAHGGWFPLAIGCAAFVLLTTWKRGRDLVAQRQRADAMPLDLFLRSLGSKSIVRVPGTAVFLTGATEGVPHALLHNLKHNKVLHETVVILTVVTEEIPHVPDKEKLELTPLDSRFYRLVVHYGFMDDPDVPRALVLAKHHGLAFKAMEVSYFLGRETLVPSIRPGMAPWREHLFAWMSRNAATAMEFFRLPTNRVVELGTQIEI
jgi:KUP system potassium uptake protein